MWTWIAIIALLVALAGIFLPWDRPFDAYLRGRAPNKWGEDH